MKVPPPERASTELRYDDPAYTDAESLERELRRVAEICHQCVAAYLSVPRFRDSSIWWMPARTKSPA